MEERTRAKYAEKKKRRDYKWLQAQVLDDLDLYYEILKAIATAAKEDIKPREQLSSIELLLGYGLGKPKQAVEVSGGEDAIVIKMEGITKEWAQ